MMLSRGASLRIAVAAWALGLLTLPPALAAQGSDTGAWVSLGVGWGNAAGSPDTNFSTSVAGAFSTNLGLLTARWVELRPMLSEPTVGAVALLYGRARSVGVFRASASLGAAYVYDEWGGRGLGLPVEATFGAGAKDVGLEIAWVADLNGLSSFWGAQLRLVAGRLP